MVGSRNLKWRSGGFGFCSYLLLHWMMPSHHKGGQSTEFGISWCSTQQKTSSYFDCSPYHTSSHGIFRAHTLPSWKLDCWVYIFKFQDVFHHDQTSSFIAVESRCVKHPNFAVFLKFRPVELKSMPPKCWRDKSHHHFVWIVVLPPWFCQLVSWGWPKARWDGMRKTQISWVNLSATSSDCWLPYIIWTMSSWDNDGIWCQAAAKRFTGPTPRPLPSTGASGSWSIPSSILRRRASSS